ncbi:amidohydrolase [Rhizobium alvei]|uniref:Amidohydrolase n=1 Tax=Rhizobium alvei TaxID=1132659 RepID=A0ABT8YP26_9HYPH|nr:amidohydrolase [Rhizobium alvei]MDO6965473.1 amidohydrolase [Rhizobium alvei]
MSVADLILINGNIVTMDPLTPAVAALAVAGGRIVALGSTEEMKALAGPQTRVVDAGGRLVLPGFQDTHIHLQDSGCDYGTNANLDAAGSIDELKETLSSFAATHDGPWVRGVGWYTGIFTEHNLDRHVLDAAIPDRPCFILASDGHNACLNSKGCEAIGLVKGTEDPFNGHFVVDADGVPTGMLFEEAVNWATNRMPEVTDEEYAAGVRYGQALCNRHGITGVLDALVMERHARVYRKLAEDGELTVRVCATAKVFPEEATADALARVEELRRSNDLEMFRIHSAKFFLDGVMENRTGVMIEPYSDAIGGNAPLMFGHEQVKELFTAFDAARFQIHVHVIGDGAVRAALDGLEAARDKNGAWPSLHQLAHIQFIDPADIPRFRTLGAVANVQALWARNEPSVTDVAVPMGGPERSRWMYAFRSLIDAGAQYTLSSDWGVSTLNPFKIMETAITRQPPAKNGAVEPFLPQERLTRKESVMGYTVNAAASAWRAESTGSLAPGKYADIIVLDRDIFTCDVYDIGDTEVQLTLLGGREVHRATGFTG